MGGTKSGKVGFAMGSYSVLQNTISRVGRQEDTRQVKATNDQLSLRTAVLNSRSETRRLFYFLELAAFERERCYRFFEAKAGR
jgi:hypothetical protein